MSLSTLWGKLFAVGFAAYFDSAMSKGIRLLQSEKVDSEGNVIEKDGVAGGSQAGNVWKYAFDNVNHLVNKEKEQRK